MTRTLSVLALSALLAAPAFAQTATDAGAAPAADAGAAADIGGTYSFDPSHSQIVFSYDHMGFSVSYGMINGVTGQVTLDPAEPAKSSVEATFPLSSIRTIDPGLDEHMYGKDLLNGAAPATAVTFRSTSVELEDGDEARVTGDLTLNGVTAPVTLDVELRKAAPNPMTQKPAVGFVAEGEIKRSDFNLGAFAPAVSDEMEIRISVEAVKG